MIVNNKSMAIAYILLITIVHLPNLRVQIYIFYYIKSLLMHYSLQVAQNKFFLQVFVNICYTYELHFLTSCKLLAVWWKRGNQKSKGQRKHIWRREDDFHVQRMWQLQHYSMSISCAWDYTYKCLIGNYLISNFSLVCWCPSSLALSSLFLLGLSDIYSVSSISKLSG
jgi:hypothetical protein